MTTIYIINGPNLNMLGKRQPEVYGHETLDDVRKRCEGLLPAGVNLTFLQSNYEGQIVEWIQEAREKGDGIVINPAAYTHTSIAIFDALMMFDGPVIEIHVSNVFARENFRHHSFVSQRANGVIAGLGIEGYEAALKRVLSMLEIA